jgi:hypothetical protein
MDHLGNVYLHAAKKAASSVYFGKAEASVWKHLMDVGRMSDSNPADTLMLCHIVLRWSFKDDDDSMVGRC